MTLQRCVSENAYAGIKILVAVLVKLFYKNLAQVIEYLMESRNIRASQSRDIRKGGWAVESTSLENWQGFIALRGFKSHLFRQT